MRERRVDINRRQHVLLQSFLFPKEGRQNTLDSSWARGSGSHISAVRLAGAGADPKPKEKLGSAREERVVSESHEYHRTSLSTGAPLLTLTALPYPPLLTALLNLGFSYGPEPCQPLCPSHNVFVWFLFL